MAVFSRFRAIVVASRRFFVSLAASSRRVQTAPPHVQMDDELNDEFCKHGEHRDFALLCVTVEASALFTKWPPPLFTQVHIAQEGATLTVKREHRLMGETRREKIKKRRI